MNENSYSEIHEIGCSDGILVSGLNLKNSKYFGYDIDSINLNKAKKKFKNYKNIYFYLKSIDHINIKNNNKKKIFIFSGVFHHLNDCQISKFLRVISSKDHIIGIDPFFHKKINIIGYLMKKFDKGQFIRTEKNYKKVLRNFKFSKKINYYLKFYSHLISYRNIDKSIIKKYF